MIFVTKPLERTQSQILLSFLLIQAKFFWVSGLNQDFAILTLPDSLSLRWPGKSNKFRRGGKDSTPKSWGKVGDINPFVTKISYNLHMFFVRYFITRQIKNKKGHVIMIQNPLSHHRRDFDKLFMSPFSVTHERTRSLSQQAISPNAAANQMPGKPSWEQKLLCLQCYSVTCSSIHNFKTV